MIKAKFSKILLALILVSSSYATTAEAATIDVSTFTDEYDTSGAGTGCSLREAVQAANTDLAFGGCPAGSGDDTINLQRGRYAVTQLGTYVGASEVSNLVGDFDINSNLTIVGEGNAETMINGASVTNLFDILAGKTVRLVDLLIADGALHGTSGPQLGGCIINRGYLTLERVVVDGCDSSPPASGPGTATYGGGGIWSMRVGSLTLLQSAVWDSTTTGNGGGIYVEGSYQMTNSRIDNNHADGFGGGIYIGSRTWGVTSLTDVRLGYNTTGVGTAGVGTESDEGIYQVRCGDGVVDTGVVTPGETCDDGADNGQPNRCNTTCNGTTAASTTQQSSQGTNSNPSPVTETPTATKETSTGSATAAPAGGGGGCGQIASGKIAGDGKTFFYLFLPLFLGFLLGMRNFFKSRLEKS